MIHFKKNHPGSALLISLSQPLECLIFLAKERIGPYKDHRRDIFTSRSLFQPLELPPPSAFDTPNLISMSVCGHIFRACS